MNTQVTNKQDIITSLVENRERIKMFGVKTLGLFGSFVRDHQRAESDIDLLVEFEPNQKNFEHFMALSFFLEDLLQRRVELITPEALSPYIGPYILEEIEYVRFSS